MLQYEEKSTNIYIMDLIMAQLTLFKRQFKKYLILKIVKPILTCSGERFVQFIHLCFQSGPTMSLITDSATGKKKKKIRIQ